MFSNHETEVMDFGEYSRGDMPFSPHHYQGTYAINMTSYGEVNPDHLVGEGGLPDSLL